MKRVRPQLPGLALAALLMLMMATEWLRNTDLFSGIADDLRQDLLAFVLSKTDQIFLVVALSIYLAALFWIQMRIRPAGRNLPGRITTRLNWFDVLRIGLAFWAWAAYLAGWKTAESGELSALRLGIDQTTNLLVLLTGLVVSYVAETVLCRDANAAERMQRTFLLTITGFLAVASLLQCAPPHVYRYHDVVRATGMWVNPNTYGLLMGTGLVLAVGMLVSGARRQASGEGTTAENMENAKNQRPLRSMRSLRFIGLRSVICLCGGALCGLGLLKSYSRGAWLATACAFSMLVWSRASQVWRRNLIPIAVVLLSVCTFAFWQFRYTANPLAQRVFSAANRNDFSWRNRVTVWRGSLEMMRDRPLLGFGWGQTEPAYDASYRARRLDDSMAIQLNDYFTLATSAGTPALLLFLGIAALSVRGTGAKETDPSPRSTACAATVLLLVGFWFDGGLFRLATGPLFWVLSEFSRVGSATNGPFVSRERGRLRRAEIALRVLAGIVMFAATVWTAALLVAPQLEFSDTRATFARKHLVPPQALTDFEFLVRQPIWRDQCLGALLDHAELANYSRRLVEWKLEEDIYQKFVLSPQVDPEFDMHLNWRRPLWEYFYPRIRRQADIETAAETALQELRSQVNMRSNAPASIQEMWQRRSANEIGFHALCVAVWRSAGIPARLNAQHRAEYWTGSEWRSVPHADAQ